jgi:tRNA(fMet)-specific endonuclease VapC
VSELRDLLDTNILSALIRHPSGPVAKMMSRRGFGTVCTSIVVAAELRFGACKRQSPTLSTKVEDLLAALPVMALDEGVDRSDAQIRFALERAGTPIGPNDLLIAAQAMVLGLVLVTDNGEEFGRIAGLNVENWLVSA